MAVVALIALLTPLAQAQATLSGTVESYNPSKRILLIKMSSGKVKRLKLRGDARCEWMGNNCSPASYRKGAKVAARLKGAFNDNPIMVDLVTDWGSSKKYVASTARAPYRTVKGDYAMAGHTVGGIPDSSPLKKRKLYNPQAVGVMAHGGKLFTEQEFMKAAYPDARTPGTNMGEHQMHSQGLPGSQSVDPGLNPYGVPGSSMPGMPANPGMSPAPGMTAPTSASSFGSTQVSFQGIVISGNANTRTLTVKTPGQAMYQQVLIGPNTQISMDAFRPGAQVMVSGLSNPNGGVQATRVVAVGGK